MTKAWPRYEIAKIKAKHLKVVEEATVEHVVCAERDQFAESLLPADFHHPDLKAMKTTGNGNCLFNAISKSLCGMPQSISVVF
jgi:hypothetical protein